MATPKIQKDQLYNKVKSFLLRPALTSNFEVTIKPPSESEKFFSQNSAEYSSIVGGNLTLWCSEAVLPGSSFLTHESNNDFHGVTERFAYRRAYDDRIDLTFYVDAERHYTIRFFEAWMKYMADESVAGYTNGRPGTKSPEYFYRFRYPDGSGGYRNDSFLSIRKFERDGKGDGLLYEFQKPYPISFQSMPVSYDTSSLLKCTVSMTYTRYIVSVDKNEQLNGGEPQQSTGTGVPNPSDVSYANGQVSTNIFGGDASLNSSVFNNTSPNQFNISPGTVSNSVGEGEEIISAVNSRQTQVESGLPYVGRNVGPLAP
jgi:hypothetical protein